MRQECVSDRVFNAERQTHLVQTFHVWLPSRRRSAARSFALFVNQRDLCNLWM